MNYSKIEFLTGLLPKVWIWVVKWFNFRYLGGIWVGSDVYKKEIQYQTSPKKQKVSKIVTGFRQDKTRQYDIMTIWQDQTSPKKQKVSKKVTGLRQDKTS